MIHVLNQSRVSYSVLQVSFSSIAATVEDKDIYGFPITFLVFDFFLNRIIYSFRNGCSHLVTLYPFLCKTLI